MAKTKAKADALPSFEQAIEQLEQIIERIERGEIGLEQGLVEYEKGTKLIAHCKKVLDAAEQKIQQLNVDDLGAADAAPDDDADTEGGE